MTELTNMGALNVLIIVLSAALMAVTVICGTIGVMVTIRMFKDMRRQQREFDAEWNAANRRINRGVRRTSGRIE